MLRRSDLTRRGAFSVPPASLEALCARNPGDLVNGGVVKKRCFLFSAVVLLTTFIMDDTGLASGGERDDSEPQRAGAKSERSEPTTSVAAARPERKSRAQLDLVDGPVLRVRQLCLGLDLGV